MTFYGLERPVDYGRQLIFDPTTANMVLLAQAAYADALLKEYYRNLAEQKEFLEKYNDFYTPIMKDLAWVLNNFVDKIRNAVDAMYEQGINPLTNKEAMMELERIRRGLDYGTFAQIKANAKTAEKYLDSMLKLQAAGLYNPELARYEGKGLDQFSTVEDGVWDRLSPTPYQNMADFSKAYFDNITPTERAARRNGIDYTVSEITDADLYDIANRHFNDLVSTPQGLLMYKRFKDQLGSDEAARAAFNDAVVAGNLDRRKYSDNYDDMYYKQLNLRLQQSANSLAWQKYYWDKDKDQLELDIKRAIARGDKGQEGTEETGFSLAQRWYDAGLANFLSSDGITKDWWDMADNYSSNASLIYDKAMKFGAKFVSSKPSKEDLLNTEYGKTHRDALTYALGVKEGSRGQRQIHVDKATEEFYKNNNAKQYSTQDIKDAFKKLYTIGMDTKSVAGAIGDTVSGNDRVVSPTAANMDKLYGINDIVSNTAGYRRAHEDDTKTLREKLKNYKPSELTITPMGDGYASLHKNGNFTVMPRVRITFPDGTTEDAYYDIGLSGMLNKGGAYVSSGVKRGGTTGSVKFGSTAPGYGYYDMNGKYVPNPTDRVTMANPYGGFNPQAEYYTGDYSLYPDYNRWTEYGNWDVRESSNLKASPSQKLGAY